MFPPDCLHHTAASRVVVKVRAASISCNLRMEMFRNSHSRKRGDERAWTLKASDQGGRSVTLNHISDSTVD